MPCSFVGSAGILRYPIASLPSPREPIAAPVKCAGFTYRLEVAVQMQPNVCAAWRQHKIAGVGLEPTSPVIPPAHHLFYFPTSDKSQGQESNLLDSIPEL